MNSLGLSAAALAERQKRLHAGDAARIMAGKWKLAYRIKMGLEEEPDFYDGMPFFIQRNVSRKQMDLKRLMGQYTEPFNLAYCQQQTGRPIDYYTGNRLMQVAWMTITDDEFGNRCFAEELQVSKVYPFMACNLDGMTTTAAGHRCVIDAKHVGQAGDPMILNYTAAGVHQATVMGTDWWALSVFIGNGKWELIEQEVEPMYQASLIAAEREFWGYVERGEEPEDRGDAILPPKPQKLLRIVQLEDEFKADWPNWAGDFVALVYDFAGTETAAKKHAIVREELKGLVPEDVGEVTRGRFRLARTKAGAITMTMKKGTPDA